MVSLVKFINGCKTDDVRIVGKGGRLNKINKRTIKLENDGKSVKRTKNVQWVEFGEEAIR